MNALGLCVALSTFAIFSVAVWNLARAPYPCATAGRVACWLLWGALNMGAAIGSLCWWMEHRGGPLPGEWQLCMMRSCVALLLLLPLRREIDRWRMGAAP